MLTTFRYYDPVAGQFVNRDPAGYFGGIVGGFGSGGAWGGLMGGGVSGFPKPGGKSPVNFIVRGSIGVDVGVFVTNAPNVGALSGPFNNVFVHTPIGAVAFGNAGGTTIITVTYGPGRSAGLGSYRTGTTVFGRR